ncbi:MAG: yclK [Thermoleophilia bacterium]|nr:yclK [Thermoleophilia bacterium]
MIAGSVFTRLHGAAIRVQVPLVLSAIPLVAALYGVGLAPSCVDLVLDDEPHATVEAARHAVTVVLVLLVACVAATTAGASMLLRGSLRAVVERLHDATGAIAAGDFRHRIHSGRDDELGRLAGSIDTMAARLERLEQARRRLLACVSHELRTPMTIIQGHAFTLARSEDDVVRRGRLEMMQEEAGRLAGLVEDLVDAASLSAGSVRLRPERGDLGELARAARDRFTEEAGRRGVAITCRVDRRRVPVDVDVQRIEQVLANLVANAVRHADPGSEVELEVRSGRGAGAPREVVVRNVGDAVPSELAERIFEPFVQCGASPGRVGLGLAIAQGLVDAHGGTLAVEQGPCGGAPSRACVEFRFSLPRPVRRGEAAAAEQLVRPAPRRPGVRRSRGLVARSEP